jgi:hypothetical protein
MAATVVSHRSCHFGASSRFPHLAGCDIIVRGKKPLEVVSRTMEIITEKNTIVSEEQQECRHLEILTATK